MVAGNIWRSRMHWMHTLGFLSWLGITAIASVLAYRYLLKEFIPTYEKVEEICLFLGARCPFKTATTKLVARAVVASLLLCASAEIASLLAGGSKSTLLFREASLIFEMTFIGGAIFVVRNLVKIVHRTSGFLDELESGRIPQESTNPPRWAKFLLLLVPRRYREHLIGDLEEEYSQIVLPEFGPRRARLWYWWQVLASLIPLVWAEAKRLAGLVVIWKSVR